MACFLSENAYFENKLHLKYLNHISEIIEVIVAQFNYDYKNIIPFYVTLLFILKKDQSYEFKDSNHYHCLIFLNFSLRHKGNVVFNLKDSLIFSIQWWKSQRMNMNTYYDLHKSLATKIFKLLLKPLEDKNGVRLFCNAFKTNIFLAYRYFNLFE